MSKPDWCPQEIWDEADSISGSVGYQGPVEFTELVARAILAAEKRGEEREREACAVVAQGEDYHTHYRTWPWWKMPDGCGNRSNESDLVRHADSIAAAIRARSTP